jgi:hypothetical protein
LLPDVTDVVDAPDVVDVDVVEVLDRVGATGAAGVAGTAVLEPDAAESDAGLAAGSLAGTATGLVAAESAADGAPAHFVLPPQATPRTISGTTTMRDERGIKTPTV